jgi:hypothetical protein
MIFPAILALGIDHAIQSWNKSKPKAIARWSGGELEIIGPTPFTVTHLVYYHPTGAMTARLDPPLTSYESGGLTLGTNQLSKLQWQNINREPGPIPRSGENIRAWFFIQQTSSSTMESAQGR